jgi:hypothetical protein
MLRENQRGIIGLPHQTERMAKNGQSTGGITVSTFEQIMQKFDKLAEQVGEERITATVQPEIVQLLRAMEIILYKFKAIDDQLYELSNQKLT